MVKRRNFHTELMSHQSGAVAIIVAILLSVFIMFAALAIDVGYAMVARNELQNIADGAALAATRTLGRLYECDGNITTCTGPMVYEKQQTYAADEALIKKAAIDVAAANQAGGKVGIELLDDEIVIGVWDGATKTLTATTTSPDAVQVTARRDNNANNPIGTFMARIMGIDTVDISAVATAALTGSSTVGPGGLSIPIAINETWIKTIPCKQDLTFHPSSTGLCAAWHSYLDKDAYQSNAHDEQKLLNDIADLSYSSPATTAGQTQFDFIGGTLASLFTSSAIQDLFNTMKVKNDGKLDFDSDSTTWTTSVPIYDDSKASGGIDCNPSGLKTIVGFASIVITKVDPPPVTTVYAKIQCDLVEPGRGGGGNYGTKGSIPGLVR